MNDEDGGNQGNGDDNNDNQVNDDDDIDTDNYNSKSKDDCHHITMIVTTKNNTKNVLYHQLFAICINQHCF